MKRFIQQLRKDERGLTLVELLAVIVILGIIATIAFVSIGNVIENSKEDAHIANAVQAISAAKLAEASQGWPETGGYTTAGNDSSNTHLDTLEPLKNPWKPNDSDDYVATVSKTGQVYSVTIVGGNLKITNATEDNLAEGRDSENLDNTSLPTGEETEEEEQD